MALVLLFLSAAPLAAHGAGDAAVDGASHGALATGLLPPEAEAQLDRRMREGVDLLYRGRLIEAARLADDAVRETPQDPRSYLLRARVLREELSDLNEGQEVVQRQALPMHAALDQAIAAADRMLDHDPKSLPARLYRGWAHLFKAQLHTLSGEYWRAGRQAKRGKEDLDVVLDVDPQNADAQGVLGTYLYFGDILPGVVKVARTLARVPGGDRERGLQALRFASLHDGYDRLDARTVLAVIYFAFEGRFEDAAPLFESLVADFPDNARFLEPLSVLDLLLPQRGEADLARAAHAVDVNAARPEDWNHALGMRLSYYQALLALVQGRWDEARTRLEALHRASPREPDWMLRAANLSLVQLDLLSGERAAAERVVDGVGDADVRHRLEFARQPGAEAPSAEAEASRRAESVARPLYSGHLAEAASALATLDGLGSPLLDFYRGDVAFLQGNRQKALPLFRDLYTRRLPERWRMFRYLAQMRAAEIQGALGDDKAAARTLGRALELYEDRDLLRHLIKARRRYFADVHPERQAQGATPSGSAASGDAGGAGTAPPAESKARERSGG
jgi:tetratricopeptide (TPR) repeat protein